MESTVLSESPRRMPVAQEAVEELPLGSRMSIAFRWLLFAADDGKSSGFEEEDCVLAALLVL
jgi:hypothetical protein